MPHKYNNLATSIFFSSYRIPNIPHISTTHSTFGNSRFYGLFLNNSPQTERFAMLHNDDVVPTRESGTTWRFYVYHWNLYALPLLDSSGRTRDISVHFYRTNPNQIFRLLPWINREITMIVRRHQVHQVMTMIEDFLIRYDITSRAFRTRMKTFLLHYTAHFIHELSNFARSHYDMIGYDRYVQYRPVFDDLINVGDDSNDDSDDDPVWVSDLDSTTHDQANAAVNRTDDSVIVFNNYRNLEWSAQSVILDRQNFVNVHGSNSGSSSSATSTQSAGSSYASLALRGVTNDGPTHIINDVQSDVAASRAVTVNTTPATLDSLLNNPLEEELVNIESDDSDECMYVSELKPPHLRTPIMVELNSDSDSDVVFVNEDKTFPPIKQECNIGDPPTSAADTDLCKSIVGDQLITPKDDLAMLSSSSDMEDYLSQATVTVDRMIALDPQLTMLPSSSDMEEFLSAPGNQSITVNRRLRKVGRRHSSHMLSSSSDDLYVPLSHFKQTCERLSPVAGGSGTSKHKSPKTAKSVAAGIKFLKSESNTTTIQSAEDLTSGITKNYNRPVRRLTASRLIKPRARIYKAPSSASATSSLSSLSSSEKDIPQRRISSSSSDSFLLGDIPTNSEGNSVSSSESSHEEFSVTKTKNRGNSGGSRTAISPLKKRRIVKRPAPPTTHKSTNIPPITAAKAKSPKSKKAKDSSSKNKRQSQSATRTIDRRQRRRRKSRQTLSKKLKNIADGDAAVDAHALAHVSKRRRCSVGVVSSSEDEVDSSDDSQSSS